MSIDFTRDEVERLTLLASAAIMNLPDSDRVLEGILDKLLVALADPGERAVRLWDVGWSEGD